MASGEKSVWLFPDDLIVKNHLLTLHTPRQYFYRHIRCKVSNTFMIIKFMMKYKYAFSLESRVAIVNQNNWETYQPLSFKTVFTKTLDVSLRLKRKIRSELDGVVFILNYKLL